MAHTSINEPTGAIDSARIRTAPPRTPQATIDRFLALDDLSSTVSDALDKLGVRGVVGASILVPTLPERRMVGPAVTVRNVAQRLDAFQSVSSGENRMTEVEGINQAGPGDVLVIEGVKDVSNMGGIMATFAARQQLAGAVVDGGVRDVGQSRRIGFPVWSSDISPITGKWRCVTEEVNGTVSIHGIPVDAGDLVVADETGTCFIPRARIAEVLVLAEEIVQREEKVLRDLAAGMTAQTLVSTLYTRKSN